MELSKEAVAWLAHGERGISSNAIFTTISGVDASGRWSLWPPADPDDLGRCEGLLRTVPEFRAEFGRMADVSPHWAALVAEWDALVALLEEEVPGWFAGANGRAPRTYAAMERIEDALLKDSPHASERQEG